VEGRREKHVRGRSAKNVPMYKRIYQATTLEAMLSILTFILYTLITTTE